MNCTALPFLTPNELHCTVISKKWENCTALSFWHRINARLFLKNAVQLLNFLKNLIIVPQCSFWHLASCSVPSFLKTDELHCIALSDTEWTALHPPSFLKTGKSYCIVLCVSGWVAFRKDGYKLHCSIFAGTMRVVLHYLFFK